MSQEYNLNRRARFHAQNAGMTLSTPTISKDTNPQTPPSTVMRMSGPEELNFQDFQNEVLEFAAKKGYLAPLEEMSLQLKAEFLLTLYIRGIIQKTRAVNVDETVARHWIPFLNWYLLEREHTEGRTIAELYLESPKYRETHGDPTAELRENTRNLRHPLYGVFIVDERRAEADGYIIHPLEEDDALHLYDRTLRVEVGRALHGLLYRFGERVYLGVEAVAQIPERLMRKYRRSRALVDLLETMFDGYMEANSGLSSRTLTEREEMFECLLDYVQEKMYTRLDQVKRMNMDAWMRWTRKRYLYVSRSREEACRRGLRQFLKYMSPSL
jgi:hypothetical protein